MIHPIWNIKQSDAFVEKQILLLLQWKSLTTLPLFRLLILHKYDSINSLSPSFYQFWVKQGSIFLKMDL